MSDIKIPTMRQQNAGADIVVTTSPYYLSRLIHETEADLTRVAVEKEQAQVIEIFEKFGSIIKARPVFSTLMQYLEVEISRQGAPLKLI